MADPRPLRCERCRQTPAHLKVFGLTSFALCWECTEYVTEKTKRFVYGVTE